VLQHLLYQPIKTKLLFKLLNLHSKVLLQYNSLLLRQHLLLMLLLQPQRPQLQQGLPTKTMRAHAVRPLRLNFNYARIRE